jgi:hypothetical protein
MAGPENRNALGKFLTEFEHIDRDLADLRLGGWHGTPFARYVRRRLQNRNVDMLKGFSSGPDAAAAACR